MSVPPVLPMGLASVHGAKISDIVVDKRPRTGRGKKLTLAQENVLKRLYEQKRPSLPEGEVPVKSFWVNLATRFRRSTGREYSWQSAKRKIMGSTNEGQSPSSCEPNLLAEAVSNGPPIVETSSPVVTGTPRQQQDVHDESQLPETRDTTPRRPPSSNSPEFSEQEKSPAVVGEWTRRALFPNARKSSQNVNSIPSLPRVSQSRRRSRSPLEPHPVYRRRSPASNNRTHDVSRRLHHQLDSTSGRASVPEYKTSPPPSRVVYARSERKPAISTRDHSIMDHRSTLPEYEVEGHSRNSEQRQKPIAEILDDSPYSSDLDELPLAPAQISRRRGFTRRVGS
jgi:hypothetical protein